MNIFKKIAFSNNLLYEISMKLKNKIMLGTHGVKVENKGYATLSKDAIGSKNYIYIGENTTIHKSRIRIRGNNNRLIIEDGCYIGEDCSFWMEGNDILIHIGKETTMTYGIHFCAQENNTKIIIGRDCMLANTIAIRTSDSHPLFDVNTTKRINDASDVIIGDHVWIAPNVKIMKGVTIGEGSVIGTETIVTKQIPENVLAVGHPARVVKKEIMWTRESLFGV